MASYANSLNCATSRQTYWACNPQWLISSQAEMFLMKSVGLSQICQQAPVSDQTLRSIVEAGLFTAPGSLADARSACAELLFAREVIKAQTTRIAQLDSHVEDRVRSSREI
jgi:hypothetical protein